MNLAGVGPADRADAVLVGGLSRLVAGIGRRVAGAAESRLSCASVVVRQQPEDR